MPFELLKTETVYPGRAFTIRRDTLRLPDGRETKFDIVEHVGSVIIIPLDDRGNLLFVRQYRHAAGLDLLELPAGTLDKGEAPEACAHREIREETGMAAGHMEHLGGFYLATDLRPDPLEADADEFLTLEYIPVPRAMAIARRAEILDAKTLAALLLAQSALEKYKN